MTAFSACLSTLCLSHADAAELLGVGISTIRQAASGHRAAKPWMFEKLADLFEMVEREADELIDDQEALGDGAGFLPLHVNLDGINLPHPSLRRAALARVMLTLGPDLIREGEGTK